MKKTILLVSAFCFINLMGMCLAQSNPASANPTMTVLTQDSGTNITNMNLTLYSAGHDWGIDAFSVGEAVKFTAPKPDWKLKQIRVLGWNGFNETTLVVPSPSNFLIEIRDENLNLLYRLADTQNAYFTLCRARSHCYRYSRTSLDRCFLHNLLRSKHDESRSRGRERNRKLLSVQ